jgi:hypothetical protein
LIAARALPELDQPALEEDEDQDKGQYRYGGCHEGQMDGDGLCGEIRSRR